MSITVSTCQQICQSPLNLSPSKNLWTFSKSERFGKLANPTFCQQAFYNLPAMIEKDQQELAKAARLISPKWLFQVPLLSNMIWANKGYKFGVSRDKMASTGILGTLNLKTQVKTHQLNLIAPGTYDLGNTLSDIRYTMRPKPQKAHQSLMPKSQDQDNMNHYQLSMKRGDIQSQNITIRVLLYSIQNHQKDLPLIIVRMSPSLMLLATKVPGPGQYGLDKTGIQQDGRYFVSKFHDSNVRSFPKEARRTGSNEKIKHLLLAIIDCHLNLAITRLAKALDTLNPNEQQYYYNQQSIQISDNLLLEGIKMSYLRNTVNFNIKF